MKKIVVLLLCVCLLMFCGCGETQAEAETEPKVEVETETENVCTVTFDTQGGSAVKSQEVVWGDKAKEPSPPTKKCPCEFAGWYLDGEKWSFIGYSVTEDITLTAKWVECHGLNEKEIEFILDVISKKYNGKKTWSDVGSVQKELSADSKYYAYTITFNDSSSLKHLILCSLVE